MKILGDDICGGQHGGISYIYIDIFYISKLFTLNFSASLLLLHWYESLLTILL